MRPAVPPGVAVLRRDAAHLQVGTRPGVVIADRPGLYPFLRGLDGTRDLPTLHRHARRDLPELDVEAALAPLIAAGVVIDAPAYTRPAVRVAIHHDGPSAELAGLVERLCSASDIAVGPEPDLTVVLSSGEPRRETFADAVQCRMAHLVVVLDADTVRIGPFVAPGRTPCLECLDRHRTAWDQARPALLPQFGKAARHGVSPLTQYAAAAEIVARCLQLSRTDAPVPDLMVVDADRTITVVPTPGFHPHCACALLAAA